MLGPDTAAEDRIGRKAIAIRQTRVVTRGLRPLVQPRARSANSPRRALPGVVRGRGIAGPGGHGRTVCRGARPGLPSRWRASGAPVPLGGGVFFAASNPRRAY